VAARRAASPITCAAASSTTGDARRRRPTASSPRCAGASSAAGGPGGRRAAADAVGWLCEAVTGTPRLPLVAESAGAVGVLSVGEPSATGHCVFFPRRHTPNLHDLGELFSLVKRVAIALELDQYNVLQNNGARAGQTVFHAHVHLVPKPTGAA